MNKSLWPWILLILGWISLASWICQKYLCGASTSSDKVEAVTPIIEEDISQWTYNDGTAHRVSADEHFRFKTSDFNRIIPISNDLTGDVTSTVQYLKSHPERALTITGYYNSQEENKSILPNLGLARANDVVKYLSSLGAPAGQLLTAGQLINDEDRYTENILEKGVDFSFGVLSKEDDRLVKVKERLFGKPITLYFGTNQDNINLSNQQRTDFADLIYYLNNVSSSKLNVSGHTDSTGARASNIALSQERANFVSTYLSQNAGIDNSRMATAGVGPDKPVANNSNKEGRALNRRVEVTLN